MIHCVDAATGKPLWTHKADGDFWASPLVADGKVYAGTRKGQFVVLAAAREKRVISTTTLPDPISGTATAANGVLYVATMRHLYAVREQVPVQLGPPDGPPDGPPADRICPARLVSHDPCSSPRRHGHDNPAARPAARSANSASSASQTIPVCSEHHRKCRRRKGSPSRRMDQTRRGAEVEAELQPFHRQEELPRPQARLGEHLMAVVPRPGVGLDDFAVERGTTSHGPTHTARRGAARRGPAQSGMKVLKRRSAAGEGIRLTTGGFNRMMYL